MGYSWLFFGKSKSVGTGPDSRRWWRSPGSAPTTTRAQLSLSCRGAGVEDLLPVSEERPHGTTRLAGLLTENCAAPGSPMSRTEHWYFTSDNVDRWAQGASNLDPTWQEECAREIRWMMGGKEDGEEKQDLLSLSGGWMQFDMGEQTKLLPWRRGAPSMPSFPD